MLALSFKIMPDTFGPTSTLWARIPVFMTGVMAAVKMKDKSILSKSILPICVILNILSLVLQAYFALQGSEMYYSYLPRLCYGPLAITFIIIAVSFFEKQRFKKLQRIFVFLGEMTLEIYLLNSKLIGFFSGLAAKTTEISNDRLIVLANILGVAVTIILAFYIHKIIEKMRLQYEKEQGTGLS